MLVPGSQICLGGSFARILGAKFMVMKAGMQTRTSRIFKAARSKQVRHRYLYFVSLTINPTKQQAPPRA